MISEKMQKAINDQIAALADVWEADITGLLNGQET